MAQVLGPLFPYLLTVPLAGFLLRLSWIDVKTFKLPDSYTLPLIVFGLGLSALLPEQTLHDRLIGAAGGFLSLGLIGEFYFRQTGAEGLGLGDAKLAAAAGAWLGWQPLPLVVLIASVTGIAFVTIFRRGAQTKVIAFGPFLCVGFFSCWVAQVFVLPTWSFSAILHY